MTDNPIHEEKHFQKESYAGASYPVAVHEECRFEACDFSNAVLSGSSFSDCVFDGCQFSMTKLGNTSFRNVRFKDCKLLGLHFEDCSNFLFTVNFENCTVKLCSFNKMNLQNTMFNKSALHEIDFTETNLGGACFGFCDLMGSIFDGTKLEKTDFRTAFNYSIDPDRNKLKKAKFSWPGITGLLDKYGLDIEQ